MAEKDNKDIKKNSSSHYYTVGIGASAGGLEAIQKLFANIREADNVAYIVVQHLSPEFKSLMDVILKNYTPLPIKVIKDKMKIEPGNIYLLSSNHIIRIENERFILEEYGASRYESYPINSFLNSLAKAYKDKSIGVILSGTGSDGSIGVQTIKKFGGITLAQSVTEASFDGMPKSAQDTGAIDLVLPVSEIADTIHSIIIDPDYAEEYFKKVDDGEEKEFNAIIELLSKHFKINFSCYKRGIISRQIKKTMMLHKIKTVADYHHALESSKKMRDELYQKFFIGVTEFCRDHAAFDGVEKYIFPHLLKNHATKPLNDTTLRFWVAGSSTGEEVYTLAYLFLEFLEKNAQEDLSYKIIATDINQRAIDIAKQGTYPKKAFKSLPEDVIKKYFTETANEYTIVPSLRHRVMFVQHDLLRDPPFLHVDLILCRNVLIYIKPEFQKEIIERFTHALNLNRFIMLGASESVGVLSNYDLIDSKWKIYKKTSQIKKSKYSDNVLEKISQGNVKFPHITHEALENFDNLYQFDEESKEKKNLTEQLYQEMLACFGIVGFIIDSRDLLIGILGKASQYLNSSAMQGVISNLKITNAICKELKDPISQLININGDTKNTAKSTKATFTNQNMQQTLLLERYFLHHDNLSYYLIQISEIEDNLPDQKSTVHTLHTNSREYELEERNLQLQRNLDILTKKHSSMRQDFMSFNEELQSANEELQSANEELYSVNAEYQQSIEKLQLLNNNMDNLLSSTHVGAVFLDRELRIRFYTQAVTQIFDLLESDVGRSIKNFNHALVFPDMLTHIYNVLNTHEPFSKEVKSKEGKSFLVRILPYLSESREVSGVILIAIDITSLQQTKHQLKISDEYLALALQSGKMGIWRWELDNDIFYVDGMIMSIFELEDASSLSSYQKFESFIHPDDKQRIHQEIHSAIDNKSILNCDVRIVLQGKVKYLQLRGSTLHETENRTKLITGVCWDITERVLLEKTAIDTESRKVLLDEICDGWWDWNLKTNEEYLSPRFKAILGYKDHELPNTVESWQKTIFPEDLETAIDNFNKHIKSDGKHPYYQQVRYKHKDGHTVWVICRGKGIKDASGEFVRMVGLHSEITHLKEKENTFEQQANSDYLTGLPNRRQFISMLEQDLKYTKKDDFFALAVVDVDNFKQVNDALGHDRGDELLISIAEYLQSSLQEGDYVARTGGDEFSIVLKTPSSKKEVATIATKIISNTKNIQFNQHHKLSITLSLGFALYPHAGKTPNQLIRHADLAMFQAKAKGKNQFVIFNEHIHAQKQRENLLEVELGRAIETKALSIAYQPIVCARSQKIKGLEVLSRWTHEKLGEIPPSEYIPIAEKSQLIIPLTKLLFEQIADDYQKLNTLSFFDDAFITINISAKHLQNTSFVTGVKKLIDTGVRAESLILEVTESALVEYLEVIQAKLYDLQLLKVRTAIDDFGTGYSSLQYLKDLPVQVLKIDQTFVAELCQNKYNEAIVKSVVSLAQTLGLKVIAEGVETKEQFEYLKNIHCDMLQGYYFARPMYLKDCLEFIRKYQPK